MKGFLKTGFVLFLVLLTTGNSFAGVTGKLTGKVIDKESGEALPGVNITVKGTTEGAATDINGNYMILNLKPGTYTIVASMVGYAKQNIENVVIRANLTTAVNIALSQTTVKLKNIVVKARQTLIRKDETSKTAIVNSKSFSNLPVINMQDVVALQAGFTKEANGDIHARGGRSGEVVYLIDGIPVTNPLNSGSPVQLDKFAIQELQVLTGGFSAEYGQALSGVVNIITKDGSNKIKGRIEYLSPMLNQSPYQKTDALALDEWGFDSNGNFAERTNNAGNKLIRDIPSAYKTTNLNNTPSLFPDFNIQGQLSLTLGGEIPYLPQIKFFLTGRYNNTLSPFPWGYSKEREVNLKLSYHLTNNIKISLYNHADFRNYKPYSHAWKYYPQGYEDRKNNSFRNFLKINHVLSNSTFYNASVSYSQNYFKRFEPGKFANFTPDGQLISSNYLRKNNNTPPFWTNADNGIFTKNETKSLMFKFDLTSQMGMHNLVKSGFEFQTYNIKRLHFQEPYPGGFHGYENYEKHPLRIAGYIQDKLEFDAFILNAGIRLDYMDVDATQWPSIKTPAGFVSNNVWIPQNEIKTKPKYQVSPRLGIAFPITDKTVFYSSYGHFFQLPNFTDMYTLKDPTLDRAIIGNPGVSAQKTVAFEFGIKQQIGASYSFDVSAFYKDITNLMGSTYFAVFPYEYTVFNNSDYGQVKGFEISLTKTISQYWYGNFNYTFSIAKGNESDPREGYNNYRRANAVLRPKEVFPLNFDRHHVFNATFGVVFPDNFGPSINNFYPLENFEIYLIFRAQSGQPYTPRPNEEAEGIVVPKNSGRIGATTQLDLRISKWVHILGSMKFQMYLTIQNLFDNINPVHVWTTTGDPWDAGITTSRTLDRQRNPTNVGVRRTIQIGTRLDF